MKISVVSLLQDIDPAYSVATVTLSHIRMLKLLGHEPTLLTGEYSKLTEEEVGCPVKPILPVWNWTDYPKDGFLSEADIQHAKEVEEVLIKETAGTKILAHDLILQGWYMPYGIAINRLEDVRHVIHSRVGGGPIKEIRKSHKICVLNESFVKETEEYFNAKDQVEVVPNAADILDWNHATDTTRRLVKDWNLLEYDYIFTYPLSAPRWHAKGVPWLATFTKYMNIQGFKTALVLLLAHANDKETRTFDENHFSNAMYEDLKMGVSRETVRDFMMISDGFIMPSISETSSLVSMEAALCKNYSILNRTLKLPYKAATADLRAINDNVFEIVLRQFLEESRHLGEFRRVRKEMNNYKIGQRLVKFLE